MKLLLIDANNMCHRVFWANRRKNPDGTITPASLSFKGREVDVLFGFMKQLVALHKDFPEHFRVIAWDHGSKRRKAEADVAVQANIVASGYKATRPKDNEAMQPMFEQMDQLREGLKNIKCLQVEAPGYEADDIIYSYTKYAKQAGGEAVIVSSDKDFFQALTDGVKIYDAMKHETHDKERFILENGFDPALWVDAGAIMGDTGDNIIGINGWGPVTTFEHVRKYGNAMAILAALKALPKRSKKQEEFVASEAKLNLALSLKQMDVLPDLPMPRTCSVITKEAVDAWLMSWGFASLLKDAWRLV